MDERAEWAEPWPFWKFGLKQSDLHTTLHEKYNTIPSAIQDPEAFHHDVYELSTRADTRGEFEELMEERKMQRLKELNTMLEDASFEIIGCPRLIGTDQWVHAVQLFRTKSLDSLVRYFASYLPDDHPWHPDSDSAINSNDSGAVSPISPIDYDGPILFDEPEEDEAIYTNQSSECFSACDISAAGHPKRAMTARSQDSGVSVNGRDPYKQDDSTRPPSRTMSVSESENDGLVASLQGTLQESISMLQDSAAASPSDDPETPSTSISDPGDAEFDGEAQEKGVSMNAVADGEVLDGYLSITHANLQAMDSMDSDAPTPKAISSRSPCAASTSFFDTNLSQLRTRSLSSTRSHPHHAHSIHVDHQDNRKHLATRQLRRREGSLERDRKASCAVGGRSSRARETSPDGMRSRARARRRRAGVQ